ncbi:hypothetical protein FWK35_00017829 [Aphis craccivora]|uniref:Uncharacterized protein n=1 Tax=Aphis craccivora TaxID=307492 RepID=A0A6G0Z646_APHCR|nr:hypothetical protein FWK35_00017829 [Aphis craccivora]
MLYVVVKDLTFMVTKSNDWELNVIILKTLEKKVQNFNL